MADPSALITLLSSDIDPLIPTMLAGDFNAFSLIWYNTFNRPIPSSLQCKSGTQIEAWALAQDLSLLSPPGVPTCKGENSQRDSILDLVWVNQQAWEDGYFSYLTYSWDESLHSDHTLICIPCVFPQKFLASQKTSPMGSILMSTLKLSKKKVRKSPKKQLSVKKSQEKSIKSQYF